MREVRGPQGRVTTCLSTSGPECLGILVRNPAGVALVEGFMWSQTKIRGIVHRWFTLSPDGTEVLGHNPPGGQGLFCVAENT